MVYNKSVDELNEMRIMLTKRLKQHNLTIGKKVNTYKLISETEINNILKSNISKKDMKNILLAEIGLIRINLFETMSDDIQSHEKNNQLDHNVEIMKTYLVDIAIPFISEGKSSSLIRHFISLFSTNTLDLPLNHIKEWERNYKSWKNIQTDGVLPQDKNTLYLELVKDYQLLYALSFSNENFPPMPTIVILK